MNNNLQKTKKYLVLLVDRQKARMFTIQNGLAGDIKEFESSHVPQKVKHGDDTWDAQDKIFRHIEDHLHRHLEDVIKIASQLLLKEKASGILIGSHRPLFRKIENHLKYPLSKKVLGKFVTELKIPKNEILKKVFKLLEEIDAKKEAEKLQAALK